MAKMDVMLEDKLIDILNEEDFDSFHALLREYKDSEDRDAKEQIVQCGRDLFEDRFYYPRIDPNVEAEIALEPMLKEVDLLRDFAPESSFDYLYGLCYDLAHEPSEARAKENFEQCLQHYRLALKAELSDWQYGQISNAFWVNALANVTYDAAAFDEARACMTAAMRDYELVDDGQQHHSRSLFGPYLFSAFSILNTAYEQREQEHQKLLAEIEKFITAQADRRQLLYWRLALVLDYRLFEAQYIEEENISKAELCERILAYQAGVLQHLQAYESERSENHLRMGQVWLGRYGHTAELNDAQFALKHFVRSLEQDSKNSSATWGIMQATTAVLEALEKSGDHELAFQTYKEHMFILMRCQDDFEGDLNFHLKMGDFLSRHDLLYSRAQQTDMGGLAALGNYRLAIEHGKGHYPSAYVGAIALLLRWDDREEAMVVFEAWKKMVRELDQHLDFEKYKSDPRLKNILPELEEFQRERNDMGA